jgi:NAD(P)-dependent dehydrogenase (short-subunit alcohol dehydrogenase family)
MISGLEGLKGKIALVTGASSGIGAATALRFATEGASVVLAGRSHERLAATGAAIEEAGGTSLAAAVDLTADGAVAELLELAHEGLGPLDVIVHSAGLYRRGPLERSPLADFDLQWRVNTRAPYELTQAALPDLVPGGSVIFVTSTAGHIGLPERAAYGATKAAAESLMRALAAELAPRGVRVNAVSPGFIASPMNEQLRKDEATMDYLRAITPAARLGRPEEVAAAAAWLASDESGFVHGQSIRVDGGYPAPPSPSAWAGR